MKFWVLLLLLFTVILEIYETWGIWHARLSGKTKNVSRIITHSLRTILLLILLFEVLYFGINVLGMK